MPELRWRDADGQEVVVVDGRISVYGEPSFEAKDVEDGSRAHVAIGADLPNYWPPSPELLEYAAAAYYSGPLDWTHVPEAWRSELRAGIERALRAIMELEPPYQSALTHLVLPAASAALAGQGEPPSLAPDPERSAARGSVFVELALEGRWALSLLTAGWTDAEIADLIHGSREAQEAAVQEAARRTLLRPNGTTVTSSVVHVESVEPAES